MKRTKPPSRPALRLESLEARDVPAGLGELDPTFGTGGLVQTTLPSGHGFGASWAAVDPFGRVMLVGSGKTGLLLGRLNPDGTPDTTFGDGGTVHVPADSAGYVSPAGIAFDAAGNIVAVAGTTRLVGGDYVGTTVVARLTADGHLDTTFGPDANGTVVMEATGLTKFAAGGVAIDAAGRVVLAGGSGGIGSPDSLAVARLTHGGVPDTTFDGDGLRIIDSGGTLYGSGVVLAPDGRIVVTATAYWTAAISVARLNPDGSSDLTFDGDGLASPAGLTAVSGDTAVDAAGNVYLSGLSHSARPVVMKLTASSAPDATFGVGGTFEGTAELGSAIQEVGLAVLADGRVVVATSAQIEDGQPAQAVVFLLTAGGQLDPAFNANGPTPGANVFRYASTESTRITSLDVTPTGDVVVGGFDGPAWLMSAARLGGPGGERVEEYGGVGAVERTLSVPRPEPETGLSGRTVRADLDADGILDTITVTAPGTPLRVAAVSGTDNATVLIPAFDPFGGDFTGGGFLAAADLDGDGWSEFVVTPDRGGGPRVAVYSLAGGAGVVRANFFGIDDASFRGGARVALGDVNGDGTPDLAVSAGFLGGPRTALFDGTTVLSTPARLASDFFAFPGTDAETLRNGAFVALGDVDGDGKAELIAGGGPDGAPRVFILDGAKLAAGDVAGAQASPVGNFFVGGNTTDRGGARVVAKDTDRDGRADVTVDSGANCRTYLGKDFAGCGEPAEFQGIDLSAAALPGGVFVG